MKNNKCENCNNYILEKRKINNTDKTVKPILLPTYYCAWYQKSLINLQPHSKCQHFENKIIKEIEF